MTTYRCRKGCSGEGGRPVYHPGVWACPKESTFDAGKVARFNERRTAAKEAKKRPPEPAPGASGAPGAAPGTSGSPAEVPRTLQGIEFGTRTAETARRDAAQKQAETDWELPAESAETFFGTILNFLRQGAQWLDGLLDAKHTEEGEIKASVFEMGPHDLAAARGGFGRRLATRVVKALGAKTVEEGIATVDSLAFLTMFGVVFMTMVAHFWRVSEQSPRLKKWREGAAKRKAAKEEAARKKLTEEQKRAALETTAKPAGAPG